MGVYKKPPRNSTRFCLFNVHFLSDYTFPTPLRSDSALEDIFLRSCLNCLMKVCKLYGEFCSFDVRPGKYCFSKSYAIITYDYFHSMITRFSLGIIAKSQKFAYNIYTYMNICTNSYLPFMI